MHTQRVRINGHDGNGNGHAAPPLSISGLQAEIGDINRTLKDLGQERESLALPALQGDAAATARIAEIDGRRLALAGRLETTQAAVRQLHAQERGEDAWRQHLAHALRVYRGTLREQRELQAYNLGRMMYAKSNADLRDLAHVVWAVYDFAGDEARRLAERMVPDSFARTFAPGNDAAAQHAAREATREARQRAVGALAAALLEQAPTVPFPEPLLAQLRTANERLQRAGINRPVTPPPSPYDQFIGTRG